MPTHSFISASSDIDDEGCVVEECVSMRGKGAGAMAEENRMEKMMVPAMLSKRSLSSVSFLSFSLLPFSHGLLLVSNCI